MNEGPKKVAVIVAAVIAVAIFAFSAFHFMSGGETHVERRLPAPAPGQVWGKAAMVQSDKGGSGPASNTNAKDSANPGQ